jgi:hypothetical protein
MDAQSMGTRIRIDTLGACALTIGRYPPFRYDARGGGGIGILQPLESGADAAPTDSNTGAQPLHFDPANLSIPPLDWRTTRFLGLPLPPGLRIAITPERLDGWLEPASGTMRLIFRARFRFSIASLYTAPDLLIDTELTTASVQGQRHRGEGQALDRDGQALLVGIDTVQPSGDVLFDRFLGLPDEALALMRCRLNAVDTGDT